MHTLLQYCIFLVLIVVVAAPFVMMLSRNPTRRAQMRAFASCFSLSACCGCFSRPRIHYDEHDLRTLRELEEPARPVGITGAYRMYQARRARMSLRLASWHEDVKKGGGRRNDINYKLQQLQAQQALESRNATAAASASASADSNGANSNSSQHCNGIRYPPQSAASAVPFDIHIVEINDRVGEDASSECSYDIDSAYAAMPDTPSSSASSASSSTSSSFASATAAGGAPSRRVNALELCSEDEEEEKADDAVHAVV